MQEQDLLDQDMHNREVTNNITSSRFTKIKQRIVLIYLSIITRIIMNTGQKLGEIQRKAAISIAIPIFRAHEAKYCQKTKSQWLKQQVWQKIYGYFKFLAQLSTYDMFNMGPNQIMAPRMKLSAKVQQFYDCQCNEANIRQQKFLEQSETQEKELNIQWENYPTETKMIQKIEQKFRKGYIEKRLCEKIKQSKMKRNEITKQTQRNNRQISNNNSANLTKLKQRLTKLYLMKLPYLLQEHNNNTYNQIKTLAMILTLIDFIHFHNNKSNTNTHIGTNIQFNLLSTINKLQLKQSFLIFIYHLFNFHCSNQSVQVSIRCLLSSSNQVGRKSHGQLEERMQAVQQLEKMILVVQELVDNKGFFRSFGGCYWVNCVKMQVCNRFRQLVIYFRMVHEWVTKNSIILVLNIAWTISSVYIFYQSFPIKLPILLCIQPLISPNISSANTPQNQSELTQKFPHNMTCELQQTLLFQANGTGTNNFIQILLSFIIILLPTTICCSYLYTRQKTQCIDVEEYLFEEYVDSSDSSQCEQEQEMKWGKL